MLDCSYMSIRRIRLMHILCVTQILDCGCLTTEVERLEPMDIPSEDDKIICASLVQSKLEIKNG